MIVTILDIVIGGLLLGGIYAIISVGLSLQYGVARVLNVSHGEFIMIGAFLTWTLYTAFGISPLVSLAITGPVVLIVGFMLHRTMYKHLKTVSVSLDDFEGKSLLLSFGLLFIIQNAALIIWGPEVKGYSYLSSPVNFWGAIFAANRLATLVISVAISIAFYLFLVRTRMGKAIRAAAQDPGAAELMGVNINRVLALVFGLGALMAGLAGSLMSMSFQVSPTMGLEYTVIAMIVIALGGLGSIPGSFLGGFILGFIGSLVSYFEPGLTMVAYYLIFMVLLMVKPTGILGR